MNIFTIGFTKKSAQKFFELLKKNNIEILIDIRLNNTSQLAGFAKYPDIEYFLKEVCDIKYIHDETFAPSEKLLKDFKNNIITWDAYEEIFTEIVISRNIESYITDKYTSFRYNNICLLCSEDTAEKCHRRLVSQYFSKLFNLSVIHL